MKVILLTDIPRVGRKYDIKDVPQGYAQNFLLKNGKAKLATPEAIKEIESKKEAVYLSHSIEKEKLQESLEKLSSVKVSIAVPANTQGYLFKGIHVKDIVLALKNTANVSIQENMIVLPEPIKTAGFHAIEVVWEGQKGGFILEVTRK